MAAASILANKDLADAAAIALAEKVIADPPVLEESVLDLSWGPGDSMIELTQVHVPNFDSDALLKGMAGRAFTKWKELDGGDFPYEKLLQNTDVKEYIVKYSYLGAISIMVRGGFTSMLKAFMDAKPPIGQYADEILVLCTNNEVAANIIKAGI